MIVLFMYTLIFTIILYLYLRQVFSTFRYYGVRYEAPLPLIGNLKDVYLRKCNQVEDITELYMKFPNEKFVGRFENIAEQVMIRDLDLVKKITIKDFDYFHDHHPILTDGSPLFAKSLSSLRGQKWKDMRRTLNPAFASSNVRKLVPLMVEVGEQMMTMLRKRMRHSKKDHIEVDIRDLMIRFGNDVIATCAFGIKVDSFKDKRNQFYETLQELSGGGYKEFMIMILAICMPSVVQFMQWDIIPERTKWYFRRLVTEAMKDRERKNIVRYDIIHMMLEAKNGNLTDESVNSDDADYGSAIEEESVDDPQPPVVREWTDEDWTAQALMFFVSGFEPLSTCLCFLTYELAVNPEVQDKLAKEIKDQNVGKKGKFDINTIQNMEYLDMVISELLRLWPPVYALDRECTKEYNLGKPRRTARRDFIVPKGIVVGVPIYAIHRDPQYFPNPNKFDPERFSEENKHKINPLAYMPFGIGPRACIGSKFVLIQLKVITCQIVLNWEISPTSSTCIPAKLSPEFNNLRLQGGEELIFKPRKLQN